MLSPVTCRLLAYRLFDAFALLYQQSTKVTIGLNFRLTSVLFLAYYDVFKFIAL